MAGSILLWGEFFQERGFFSLELTWVLTLFPQNSSYESMNQSLVCAHMHSIARTQKIPTFISLIGECRQQKHTRHAPSTKIRYLNVATSMVALRNGHHHHHHHHGGPSVSRMTLSVPLICGYGSGSAGRSWTC